MNWNENISPIVNFRIPYIICSADTDGIGHSVDLLDTITCLPISLDQLASPGAFHIECQKHMLQAPHQIIPIYFGTQALGEQIKIVSANLPFFVIFVPNLSCVEKNLATEISSKSLIVCRDESEIGYENVQILQLRDTKGIVARIISLIESLSGTSSDQVNIRRFADHARKNLANVDQFPAEVLYRNNFKPCLLNFKTAQQILGSWHAEIPLDDVRNKPDRGSLVVPSAVYLQRLWNGFYSTDESEENASPIASPTTILITPWLSPEVLDISSIKGFSEAEMRRLVRLLKQPQNPDRFLSLNIEYDKLSDESEKKLWITAGTILAHRTDLVDVMGSLHSSFFRSPIIRTAKVGGQFNSSLSIFRAHTFARRKEWKKLRKTIEKLGREIAASLPERTLEFLEASENQIFCIGDLPVEWLMDDGIPLSFLYDVCRIPESSLDILANQYLYAASEPITISKDILQKTLYVCCDNSDPVIRRSFILAREVAREIGISDIIFEECDSSEDFFKSLKKYDPMLLIVDGHGAPSQSSENQTDIKFKNDRLTPGLLKNHFPTPPLVILSCCATSPLFGYSNSIAQAFLRSGSRSVTAAILPIDWSRAASFNIRLINNLQMASELAIHSNWLAFVSHVLRTSVCDDFLYKLRERGQSRGDSVSLSVDHAKIKVEWLNRFFHPPERRAIYKDLGSFLPRLVSEEHQSLAKNILNQMSFEPEHLYYCHLGRPDLVPFESYLHRHSNADRHRHHQPED